SALSSVRLPQTQLTITGRMACADNEWSPLKAVILGRAENSCFPSEPAKMIEATMPKEFHSQFRPHHPFPAEIVRKAVAELDNFAMLLKREGVKVYRPKTVDWNHVGGYTGAMPRDGLLTVGNHVIEACFAWGCRRQEIELAFGDVLSELEAQGDAVVVRAPKPPIPDTIYETHTSGSMAHTNGSTAHANGSMDHMHGSMDPVNGSIDHGIGSTARYQHWAINNSRPAFDAADFMRFGKVLIGQLSNVTNEKGVEYLRQAVPKGYSVEILEADDPHAMHIDATILPLRP
ncbi:MAG: hypothetical protein Q9181_008399, partial [Wetmoreana brouardii]